LIRAAEVGTEEGLHFVYAGNLPGQVGAWENTRCPKCSETLIGRYGYLVRNYRITAAGACPRCGDAVPGIWPAKGPAAVRTGDQMVDYYRRLPRRVNLRRP
jgi:pyruvate formate lyase activating enzyme